MSWFKSRSLSAVSVAIGQALEADSTFPMARVKTRAIGQAVETDVAQTIIASVGTLPLGTLRVDGVAMPHMIPAMLPITGSIPVTATATVRYKRSVDSTYIVGHPLVRIRTDLVPSGSITVPGSLVDGFAWPMIDMLPGTSYDVEVTVTSGATVVVKTLTTTTRALPPPAAVTGSGAFKTATPATVNAVFAAANPGDVIELQNGNYSGLTFNRSGTAANLIYVRGQTRAGVKISATGYLFTLQQVGHVVFENFTMLGSGVDDPAGIPLGNAGAKCKGFEQSNNGYNSVNITIREIDATGIDSFVYFFGPSTGTLVYNYTVLGNNVWQLGSGASDFLGSNITWNDDCIHLPGVGHSSFYGAIRGFGDTFGPVTSGESYSYSHHYHHHDIQDCTDDGAELDECIRLIAVTDNRYTNCTTADSGDGLFGGPFLYARNVYINLGSSQMHKWNGGNGSTGIICGIFVYNCTYISTVKAYRANPTIAQWYQPTNGNAVAYGYRNNIHIGPPGTGWTIRDENSVHDPVDHTHNSWFPEFQFQWNSQNYTNLANLQATVPNKTPVVGSLYSPNNRPFAQDNITVAQPFTTTITLPANSGLPVTTKYAPIAAHVSIKGTGLAIPGITGDGVANPDRGAYPTGVVPAYGDQSGKPAYLSTLTTAGQMLSLTGSLTPVNGKITIRQAMPSEWLTNDPGGVGDTSRVDRIIRAYSGGAKGVTPVLRVGGAGHNDGANSALCSFDTRGTTAPQGWTVRVNTVAQALPPTAIGGTVVRFQGDGWWSPVHTYDGFVYASHNGMVYRFGGSYWNAGDQKPWCYKYDPSTGANPTQLPDLQSPQRGYGTFYDPVTHKILVWKYGDTICQFFRCDTDTFSGIVNMNLLLDECSGAWDYTRGRGIVMDGSNSSLVTINFASETVSVQRISFTGATTIVGQNDVSALYDQPHDAFYFFGGSGTSPGWQNIYKVPAAGPTWPITAIPITGGTIGVLSTQVGSYGRYAHMPDWGVVFTVADVDAPVVAIYL